MSPELIGMAAFAATFGGALMGMWVARRLPEAHRGSDTRDAISVSMAVVGTLAALVLGLLITQASTSFATKADAVSSHAANLLRADRVLQRYGPDANGARAILRQYAVQKAAEISIGVSARTTKTAFDQLEDLNDHIIGLQPSDDAHRARQQRALHIVTVIADERWLLVEKASTPIPTPFIVLLIFWLALLFASFGLFAPQNATIVVSLFLCALAVSGGVYLIIELDNPTLGLIRTPTGPQAAVHELQLSGVGSANAPPH